MARHSQYLIGFFILFACVQYILAYVCTSNYCDQNPCSVDINCEKKNNSRTIKNGGTCGCCDICILQLELGDPCNPELVAIPSSECGSGLTCSQDGVCVKRNESQCINEQMEYDDLRNKGYIVPGKTRPKCDYWGYYDSVKCIAGSVCFCVSKEGERIFGTDFVGHENNILCNCSRDANYLLTSLATTKAFSYGSENYTSPPPFAHCLPNGNYDPLQCVNSNCFCLSKDLKLTSAISSETIKETLVCYDPRYHREEYIRGCEKVRDEILLTMDNYTLYGAHIYGVDVPNCDLDGSYAPVQCLGDKCFCADRFNGTQIGNYVMPRYSEEAHSMSCHCARDTTYVTDPMLKKQYVCDSKGDYYPLQCQGSLCYCVNPDGTQTGAEVPWRDRETLTC
ncbi:hypothetical protein CHUAL_012627 [Chamberlinius hualienensis]